MICEDGCRIWPFWVEKNPTTLDSLNQSINVLLQHIERTMHNLEGSVVHHDHGLLLIPFDINGLELMKKHGAPHLEKAQRIHCDPNLPYCGLPYYLPLITMMRWDT